MERPQQAQPLHCPESLHTTWLSQSCDLNGWAWAGGQSICSKESGGVRGLHYPEQLAGCPGSCPPHDLSQQYPGSLSLSHSTLPCVSQLLLHGPNVTSGPKAHPFSLRILQNPPNRAPSFSSCFLQAIPTQQAEEPVNLVIRLSLLILNSPNTYPLQQE